MPKNLLYFRGNYSILLAKKYKLAYILAFLDNKNPFILKGKSLTYYIFLYLF